MASLFNLNGIVLTMANETVTVTRYVRDTYDVNGRAIPRSPSTVFTPRVNVQPLSGSDQRMLPDGADASEFVSIWSASALLIRDRVAITSRAGTFEVTHLDPWQTSGNYCKVIAKRLSASEPGEV